MTTATQLPVFDRITELRRKLKEARSVAFTEMAKVRHAVALAKVPYVVDHLAEALEAGPVVCFAHHKDVVDKIAEAFADRCVVLTGDTPMAERQAAVDDFQNGRADLFIGNIQAAGVGITLTRSAHVVFAELDWVPGNLSQAEDRCHRIGQTDSVLVQHLVLEGSVDANLVTSVLAKQQVIDKALDAPTVAPQAGTLVTEVEIELKPDRVTEAAAKVTAAQVAAAHHGLRILAGMCDGAAARDGCGFNKMDTAIGKKLAALPQITTRQAVLAIKFCTKYHRQLPADLVAAAKGN